MEKEKGKDMEEKIEDFPYKKRIDKKYGLTKEIIECNKKCCKLECCPDKKIPNGPWHESRDNISAGVFVIDPVDRSALFVQSYNKFWGPPKGKIEVGETDIHTALRELEEETGIKTTEEKFIKKIRTKYCVFFLLFVNRKDVKIDIQSLKGIEITGLGWFSFDCLEEHFPILNEVLNNSAKYLIRRIPKIVYGKNIGTDKCGLNLKINLETYNIYLTLKVLEC